MPLSAGTRLGVYEVTAPIGEGGMGQVYRATDTTLGRQVAIKILPDAFAADPERVARFEREAKTLGSLNHPHIAAIYGFEKSGGTHALVMELVAGEDLSDVIARGPLALTDALPIARQIIDALEAAHELGIVHRDLKPANIKIRDDGAVKVLDFGLAKAMEPAAGSSPGTSMFATITTPAMTQVGMILGTAAYMSPEQAKGRVVDKRTDVWAFGCVFFEMLTGRRAFEGEDVTDTIAAVVRGEPDWRALPANVPEQIRLLLMRCLEKDRRARIADISVARFLMTETIASIGAAAGPTSPVVARPTGWRAVLPWAVAACALVVAAGVVGRWAPWRTAPSPKPVRFTVAPAGTAPLAIASPYRDFALSPDGQHLVYTTGISVISSELWVRAVDQLEAVQLRGLTAPQAPFVSPDSKWIGFFSQAELKKVSMTGGPAIAICRLGSGISGSASLRGASWGPNETIVFATADFATGLFSVPAGGGEPRALTKPDPKQGELDHLFPFFLPGGQAVLFTITTASGLDNSQVAVLDLKTGKQKTLVRGGGHAEYVETGHLIYAAAGSLRAVRFDPGRLEVLSDPVPVVEHVLTKPSGAAEYSVSREGALVYLAGGVSAGTGPQRTLVWVDRKGHEEPIKALPRAYQRAALSPDGTRLALDVRDQGSDIWTWDLAHETLTRLTTDPAPDSFPVWTADSRRVIFQSAPNGESNLYWQLADGSGPVERLTTSPNVQAPMSIAPDGSGVIVRETKASSDLFFLHLDGKREMEPLLQSTFDEHNGVISPDGHWIAYDSNNSNQAEVYVRPFPNVNGGQWQISTRAGHAPLWAPNGRELFFLDATDHLTSVPVQPSASGAFNFGTATRLLDTAYFTPLPTRNYDVSRDGQRFLMIKDPQAANPQTTSSTAAPATPIVVVLHWFEELKARVPSK